MYQIEDRGNITRYYNAEKRAAVEKLKGAAWKRYRKLWDAKLIDCSIDSTTPPRCWK